MAVATAERWNSYSRIVAYRPNVAFRNLEPVTEDAARH